MREKGPDFRLGEWIVRSQRCRIERGTEVVRVAPRCMAVLEHLARAQGAVVLRNELFDTVWPGMAVSDDVLTQCIVALRKAFGDTARDPRIIETIPKKGFRLVASVAALDGAKTTVSSWRPSPRWIAGAAVLAVIVAASVWQIARQSAAVVPETKSVAVLPFVDLSEAQNQGYFADGLSEEMISRLSRLDGLLVTGRTSSFYFKGRHADLRSIGRHLSVNYVLEGSVRRSERQLRITAQLVEVSTGYHLWSETFDRPYADIFAVQQEIAEAVATALSVRLGVGELGTVAGGTDNVDAFEEFLLGASLLREFTAQTRMQAARHFRRATELDPDFALAWQELAYTYRTAWLTLGEDDAETWRRLADEALARAEESAPDAPFVVTEAAYRQVDQGNWSEAHRLFEKLRDSRDSRDAGKFGANLDFLMKTGRLAAAERVRVRYQASDPLNPDLALFTGHILLMQGHADDALTVLEAGLRLGGWQSQISVEGLVSALAGGDPDLIRAWLERAVEHQQPGAKGVHDAMLARLGEPDAALGWLRSGFEAHTIADYYVIVWASYYGDRDLALAAMQRSPDLWAFWIPLTRSLRQTEEFKDILTNIGLVDYFRRYGWNDYCHPVGDRDFACR